MALTTRGGRRSGHGMLAANLPRQRVRTQAMIKRRGPAVRFNTASRPPDFQALQNNTTVSLAEPGPVSSLRKKG
jgi:hypothetical protein